MRKKVFGEILLLLLLSLVPLWWFRGEQMLIGHDSGFRLLPVEHLKNLFYSWNSYINLGKDWSLYKAFLVTQFPEAFFSFMTGSVLWGQRLALIFWFFSIGFGMWLGIYLVFSEQKYRLFRLWSAVFAMYNFYIFQGWFIGERAKFSLFAALPVAIALLYRTIVRNAPIARNAVYFGLLYFLLNGGGSPPLYGSTVVALFIIYVWFSVSSIRKNGWGDFKRCVGIGGVFLVSFLVLNFYWIFPQLRLYITTYAQALGDSGGIDGLVAWEQGISKNASLLNLLRLQGIPDWYDNVNNSFAQTFITNPLLITLSFLPIVFTLVCGMYLFKGYLTKKHEKEHQFFIGLALVLGIGLIFAGGSHPPFGFLFVWAMRHLPGFAIFRSSFYKFAPMVWIPIILLSGYALNRLISSLRSKLLAIALSVLCIGYILAYHYPFFTADVFTFMNPFSTRVSIPSYVTEMGQFVNTSTKTDARILILPALDSGYYNVLLDTSSWGYFSLDILPRSVMSRGLIANDNDASPIITSMYEALRNNDKARFMQISDVLGITYILWRDDAMYKNPYDDNRSIISQKKNFISWSFVKVKNIGLWTLYMVPTPQPLPRIYAASSVFTTYGTTISHSDVLTKFAKDEKTITIDTIPLSIAEPVDSISSLDIVQATCVACSQKERDRINNDILLVDPSYQPGSLLFERKERIERKALERASSIESKIDAQVTIANTKLQRTKWYMQNNKQQEAITNFEDYQLIMNTVVKQVSGLTGKTKNDYALRIHSFLQAQQRYVETIGIDMEQKKTQTAAIAGFEQSMLNAVWMTTDNSTYKFEAEIPQTDTYTIVSNLPNSALFIDEQPVTKKEILITEGYHKLSVFADSKLINSTDPIYFVRNRTVDKPFGNLSFTKINPTKYSGEVISSSKAVILVFNEQFDRRWKMAIDGKTVPEENHIRADGYANAWVLELKDTHKFTIYYEPQNAFYVGGIITLIGLIGSFIVIKRIIYE